ncbi:hypothetical protein [Marinoscillum sp. MHG1-6]|uniref:glycoside hydrolase family 19 protein n=1 Tax=Marinoscillum sp. MHG1-6 TaxID=2959627 RepID=UPI0021570378|nr:hypothetical protein [Marinoscillum sp. MHG1-6]
MKGEGDDRIEGHWIFRKVAVPVDPEFPITTDQLSKIFPNNKDTARIREVVEVLNELSNVFELTTKGRMAHFLAQIGAETGGLADLDESSHYSPRRIVELFGLPKYADLFQGYNSEPTECVGVAYESDGGTLGKGRSGPVSPVFLYDSKLKVFQAYGHPATGITTANLRNKVTDKSYNSGILKVKEKHYGSDSKLFDVTYACRMGNAGPSSGHGSTFKGKGFIHLTGRWTYKKVSELWNADILNENNKKYFHKSRSEGGHLEDLINDVEVALKASLYYWRWKKYGGKSANELSDQNDIVSLTKLVNGGKNGIDDRKIYYKNALNNLGDK